MAPHGINYLKALNQAQNSVATKLEINILPECNFRGNV